MANDCCAVCQERLERIEEMLRAMMEAQALPQGEYQNSKDIKHKIDEIGLVAAIKSAASQEEAHAIMDAWNASRRQPKRRTAR